MEYKSLTNLLHNLHNSYNAARRSVAGLTAAAMLTTTAPVYGNGAEADADAALEAPTLAQELTQSTNTPPYDVRLTTDKQVYAPGEQIEFTISAKDREGNMVTYILRPEGNETQQPMGKLFYATDSLETTVSYQARLPYGVNQKEYTALLRVVDTTRVGDEDALDQGTAVAIYQVVYTVVESTPEPTTAAVAEATLAPVAEPTPSPAPTPEPVPEATPAAPLVEVQPALEPTPAPACSDDAVEEFARQYIGNLNVIVDGNLVSVERRDLEHVLNVGSIVYTPPLHQTPTEFADRELKLEWVLTAPHTRLTVTAADDTTSEVIEGYRYVIDKARGTIYAGISGKRCDNSIGTFAEKTVDYNLRDEEKKKGAAVVALIFGGLAHAGAIVLGGYCAETGNCQPQGDDDDDDDVLPGQGDVIDDGSLIE